MKELLFLNVLQCEDDYYIEVSQQIQTFSELT